MNAEELRDKLEEMVVYILPIDASKDKDIVQNYTDTFVMIVEEYHKQMIKSKIKKLRRLKRKKWWNFFWANSVIGILEDALSD
jgi:hypothetical protein